MSPFTLKIILSSRVSESYKKLFKFSLQSCKTFSKTLKWIGITDLCSKFYCSWCTFPISFLELSLAKILCLIYLRSISPIPWMDAKAPWLPSVMLFTRKEIQIRMRFLMHRWPSIQNANQRLAITPQSLLQFKPNFWLFSRRARVLPSQIAAKIQLIAIN